MIKETGFKSIPLFSMILNNFINQVENIDEETLIFLMQTIKNNENYYEITENPNIYYF